MTNLQPYNNEGIEIYIDTKTGESYASQRGYARMANKNQSVISKRVKSDASTEYIRAEVPTTQGLRTVSLIPEIKIAEWLPKDNPEMATKMMRLGVRVFLHKLAGYEVTSTATQPSQMEQMMKLMIQQGQQMQGVMERLDRLEGTRSYVDNLSPGGAIIREHQEKLMALPPSDRNYRATTTAPGWLKLTDPVLFQDKSFKHAFCNKVAANQKVQKLNDKLPKVDGRNQYYLYEVEGIFVATYQTLLRAIDQ